MANKISHWSMILIFVFVFVEMGICICWNVYLHLLECGAAAVGAAAIEGSHWSTEHDCSTNQNQECYRTNTIINSKDIQIQVKIQIQRKDKYKYRCNSEHKYNQAYIAAAPRPMRIEEAPDRSGR